MTSSTTYRKDYRPPTHRIESVSLVFDLDPETTKVHSTMRVVPAGKGGEDLVLNAGDLSLVSIYENSAPLPESRYTLTPEALVVHGITGPVTLGIVSEFHPGRNTLLSGIFMSNGNFMSQCESEGFRRITYFPDRPDVLTRFQVEIRADKERYPVLLSNGNLVAEGELANGRHYAKWDDPSLKPCYLFALVAGRFVKREETIRLRNNKDCLLQVWVEPRNAEKTAHTLECMKRAFKWDEERWGLVYDLDRFMLVATDDFNFGAMENKGLNVFNSKYVLATPESATDTDYFNIESVVGHEYFHNWTGDRVTVRDWFQLTLKEGLTVFRDQEFSRDMLGRGAVLKRIMDVRALRARQFPEDAGPMAHPIRPESYREINNFYTTTVYEKGAEVFRMLQTMLGRETFARGLSLYLERNDGKAVSCEDFINAMAEVAKQDLHQFFLWFSQAGTPRVSVSDSWDAETQTYTITASQSTPATPGQPVKKSFVIPISVGLVDPAGRDLPLQLESEDAPGGTTRVLTLSHEEQSWTFVNIPARPVPSLLRDFSAPVTIERPYSKEELAFLARRDSDLFNRWDAMSRLMLEALDEAVDAVELGYTVKEDKTLLLAFEETMSDKGLDPGLRAKMLTLPSEREVAERRTLVDPSAVRKARNDLKSAIGKHFTGLLFRVIEENATPGPYSPDPGPAGMRALKSLAYEYLLACGNTMALLSLTQQFERADNLTDRISALTLVAHSPSPAKIEMLRSAAMDWKDVPTLINKLFTIQASGSSRPGETRVVDSVRRLMASTAYSPRNPNNVYSLLGAFCANEAEFHDLDGSGYALWLEALTELCGVNAIVAARIARCLERWRRYTPDRAVLMREALERASRIPNLPVGVREIIDRSLGNQTS